MRSEGRGIKRPGRSSKIDLSGVTLTGDVYLSSLPIPEMNKSDLTRRNFLFKLTAVSGATLGMAGILTGCGGEAERPVYRRGRLAVGKPKLQQKKPQLHRQHPW